jgi:hypothetical protein
MEHDGETNQYFLKFTDLLFTFIQYWQKNLLNIFYLFIILSIRVVLHNE